ncbi:MAG: hypothetical protein WED34_05560 [Planctomycetales bacterium]
MATAAICATWAADANAADRPERKRLAVAEIEKLHAFLKPQPGESRWMEIDWYPNVWEGRQQAIAEGKPLFLWAGSGGAPVAGC